MVHQEMQNLSILSLNMDESIFWRCEQVLTAKNNKAIYAVSQIGPCISKQKHNFSLLSKLCFWLGSSKHTY